MTNRTRHPSFGNKNWKSEAAWLRRMATRVANTAERFCDISELDEIANLLRKRADFISTPTPEKSD